MPALTEKDYIVNVGPGGTFRKSGDYQTVPEDIDRMFEQFRANQVKKIALYFHGGLVNEKNGLASAARVGKYLEQAGAAPVCFVWESGLVETLSNNISKISETKLFKKLLKLLLKKITEKIGFDSPKGRGIAGKPLTDIEIEYELSTPDPFNEYNRVNRSANGRSAVNLDALAANQAVTESELRLELEASISTDPEFVLLVQQSKVTTDATGNSRGARGFLSLTAFVYHVVKIAWRVISRFIKKRDHDLYPTIVEEILREFYIAEVGAWIWKSMKDKAEGMWASNTGRQGLDQYAGRYFLDQLAQYKKQHPDVVVNVVGHSAGAIVTCHLLRVTAGHGLPFKFEHIVFLAPACRVELFEKEMLDTTTRFKDLRIFTMTDVYECRDRLVPYFYTHSLLYLVSGILEDEGDSFDAYILGLQRHIDFLSPYDVNELEGTHDYLYETGKDRCTFSVTAAGTGAGLQTHSESHGGFDDDVLTLQSVQFIIQNL